MEKIMVEIDLDTLSSLRWRASEYDLMMKQKRRSMLEAADHKQWMDIADSGETAKATIRVRELIGCSLSEALGVVRTYKETGNVELPES